MHEDEHGFSKCLNTAQRIIGNMDLSLRCVCLLYVTLQLGKSHTILISKSFGNSAEKLQDKKKINNSGLIFKTTSVVCDRS